MHLLKELQSQGHSIYVIATKDEYSPKLEQEGFKFFDIKVSNNSKNPLTDINLIRNYIKIYKKISPDIILHNAIKPNIYGTIAAGILGIKTINNISGLGTLFIKESISTKIAKFLYKISQKKATKVFFQNPEDRKLFLQNKLISENKSDLIPGSGVDTKQFSAKVYPKINSDTFRFLFIGRLIKDKGIIEYFESANHISSNKNGVRFNVLGPLYEENETGIGSKELEKWTVNEKIVYLGETDNVASELAKCDCLVLPSYREGLSKVLIEASSMRIPIVTTNVPGCKHVVTDGINGLLCKAKDSKSLEKAMLKILDSSKEELIKMGEEGRKIAINKFDIRIVVGKYIDAINQIKDAG